MKYTDLCIYIDKNSYKLAYPGQYPEEENLIYNYCWLLVKSLALKKKIFQKFEDYDAFAFYAAERLFFAMRKSYMNEGKVIKGKTIKPIKSILNYTKALIYGPMKLDFQNMTFREIIDETSTSGKLDEMKMKADMRAAAASAQGVDEEFWSMLVDSLERLGKMIDKVIESTPLSSDPKEARRLKISVMLTLYKAMQTKKEIKISDKCAVVWDLPKSMSGYIQTLAQEVLTDVKKEIVECYQAVELDDGTLDNILNSAYNLEEDNENH